MTERADLDLCSDSNMMSGSVDDVAGSRVYDRMVFDTFLLHISAQQHRPSCVI